MNIYLIFIVTCLTEQFVTFGVAEHHRSEPNIYLVKPGRPLKRAQSIAIIELDPNNITATVTFINDVKKSDLEVEVTLLDYVLDHLGTLTLHDPCNVNTLTKQGTLAAILWRSLGIDSCPIAAVSGNKSDIFWDEDRSEEGKYQTVSEFNQTGNLEGLYKEYLPNKITVIYDLHVKSNRRKKYLKLTPEIFLFDEKP